MFWKLSFLIIPLILMGAGCDDQTIIIQEQQKQISELTSKLEQLNSSTLQTKIAPVKPIIPQKIQPQIIIKNTEDPQIKIERCKAQAKMYADNSSKNEYLYASQEYAKKGYTEEAALMLEASLKPEHPANYDNNYGSAYVKCLNN